MSISKADAQSQTELTHAATVLAANTNFYAAADVQIAEAIAEGKSWTACTVMDTDVDPATVAQYYIDLGYQIQFLTSPLSAEPALLFGQNYTDYWSGHAFPKDFKKPFRIKISWVL